MALASAGLLLLGAGTRAGAQAQQQEKLSKPKAEYQDTPKNDQQMQRMHQVPAAERLLGGVGRYQRQRLVQALRGAAGIGAGRIARLVVRRDYVSRASPAS
jgi:hypothetical protein